MTIIAQAYDYVVGVDTHARTHTFAIIETRTGAVVDTAAFPTTGAGITRAISWIRRRTNGRVFAAVEGTSSYGAKLTTALTGNGIPVAEVRPQPRAKQAVTGKSDVIDAEAAARSALGQDESRIATPRATGDRSALRVLLAARKLMDQQRTACRNALTALLRTIELRVDAADLSPTPRSLPSPPGAPPPRPTWPPRSPAARHAASHGPSSTTLGC